MTFKRALCTYICVLIKCMMAVTETEPQRRAGIRGEIESVREKREGKKANTTLYTHRENINREL